MPILSAHISASEVTGGSSLHDAPIRVMFTYWGRRGLTRFVQELAQAAIANPKLEASISVSRQNEAFADFQVFGSRLIPVETFGSSAGALGQSWRIPSLGKLLAREIAQREISVVIELMPHVWSSFVVPAALAGRRYATIVHDADSHPGDYRSFAIQGLVRRTIRQADVVLTLSGTVAERLAQPGRVPREKLLTLFHPDLGGGPLSTPLAPRPGETFRLAFLGRIMPYKGLSLFVDAVEALRKEGLAVAAGVFGEGPLEGNARRLEAMGAEIVNRWLTNDELQGILSRFHAVGLSHVEASQSGVAALAFGAGRPVVATPVGGLTEQVKDGFNGVLAARVDAAAFADAVRRLVRDPALYMLLCRRILASRQERSMSRFVEHAVLGALSGPVAAPGNQPS